LPRFRIALCSIVLATAFAAAGCSSSSKSSDKPTGTTTATASGATISIKNFMFGDPITVKAGATVTVKNTDATTHTLASDDKAFDTGNINGGASATFVAPAKAGTYKFHCNIHDYMHGSIIVTSS
jgi:plastocyanin